MNVHMPGHPQWTDGQSSKLLPKIPHICFSSLGPTYELQCRILYRTGGSSSNSKKCLFNINSLATHVEALNQVHQSNLLIKCFAIVIATTSTFAYVRYSTAPAASFFARIDQPTNNATAEMTRRESSSEKLFHRSTNDRSQLTTMFNSC